MVLAIYSFPSYSDRLSLVMAGYPFARTISHDRLPEPYDYPGYNMRTRAIVLWRGQPIGWIYQHIIGLRHFEAYQPASPQGWTQTDPNFERLEELWFRYPVHDWSAKALALYIVLLAMWGRVRVRGSRVTYVSAAVGTVAAVSLPPVFPTALIYWSILKLVAVSAYAIFLVLSGWIYVSKRLPAWGAAHVILMLLAGLPFFFVARRSS
jgi:hypothetical protein